MLTTIPPKPSRWGVLKVLSILKINHILLLSLKLALTHPQLRVIAFTTFLFQSQGNCGQLE
jgi:hypothetical protein